MKLSFIEERKATPRLQIKQLPSQLVAGQWHSWLSIIFAAPQGSYMEYNIEVFRTFLLTPEDHTTTLLNGMRNVQQHSIFYRLEVKGILRAKVERDSIIEATFLASKPVKLSSLVFTSQHGSLDIATTGVVSSILQHNVISQKKWTFRLSDLLDKDTIQSLKQASKRFVEVRRLTSYRLEGAGFW